MKIFERVMEKILTKFVGTLIRQGLKFRSVSEVCLLWPGMHYFRLLPVCKDWILFVKL